mmetsp:Transcript_11478/g.27798  ORF Transcript_11478/g.27798 Transcript_11478/m.27798 type:complete len:244 (-) Transcript_11478:344-1075(-)
MAESRSRGLRGMNVSSCASRPIEGLDSSASSTPSVTASSPAAPAFSSISLRCRSAPCSAVLICSGTAALSTRRDQSVSSVGSISCRLMFWRVNAARVACPDGDVTTSSSHSALLRRARLRNPSDAAQSGPGADLCADAAAALLGVAELMRDIAFCAITLFHGVDMRSRGEGELRTIASRLTTTSRARTRSGQSRSTDTCWQVTKASCTSRMEVAANSSIACAPPPSTSMLDWSENVTPRALSE